MQEVTAVFSRLFTRFPKYLKYIISPGPRCVCVRVHVCVYMHVCVHVCVVRVSMCVVHACVWSMRVRVCMCARVCVVRVSVVHVSVRVVHACVCVVRVCVCTCVYMCSALFLCTLGLTYIKLQAEDTQLCRNWARRTESLSVLFVPPQILFGFALRAGSIWAFISDCENCLCGTFLSSKSPFTHCLCLNPALCDSFPAELEFPTSS